MNTSFHRRLLSVVGIASGLLLARPGLAEDLQRYRKAIDAYNQQIYLSAISEARAQLRVTPEHAPSWRLIARAYLTLNKCSDASSAGAAAYNIMNQSVGASSLDQGDMDKIVADLDARCPGSLELGRIYSQSKDYTRAARHYRLYLEKNPGDNDARLELAQNLSWGRSYGASAEHYRIYLRSQPRDLPAIMALADVYAANGDLRSSEAQLKRVLTIEPGNADAMAKLGRVQEWQGQYKSAGDAYEQAVALAPDNESAREGRSRVKELAATASRKQRAPSSVDIVEEIEKTGDFSLYFKLAEALYHNEGKTDEALKAYRRYRREFPNDAAGALKLARVLGWEKQYDDSIPMYRQYLKMKPEDATARLELANILSWSGRRSEALVELNRIKQEKPAMVDAYLAAGDILRWQRDFPGARENYKKVLQLDPVHAGARTGLYEISQQWTAAPVLRMRGEKITMSDIDFVRGSGGLQAEFHPNAGRIDFTPGVVSHHFKQRDVELEAKEAYLNLGFPIQNEWRWWGGASALEVEDRKVQVYPSIGIEGLIGSRTWMRVGYIEQDAVFESNNLTALLAEQSLRLKLYDLQIAQSIPGNNQLKASMNAGFYSDTNSRMRLQLQALHRLAEEPIVTVGLLFKALSFSETSSMYWSPTSYSGPGATARLERKWDVFSYKAGVYIYRITQTSQTEAGVDGGLFYEPRHGFFASITGDMGRGAGASVGEGSTNTLYQDFRLNAGYKF